MPVITSIKLQKNRKRLNIYLDDKFGFGIDLENFVKYNLKVEQELSNEEIAKIVKEAEFQKTYDKILLYASLRPRSEKEYKMWLKKHKVPESLENDLFKKLIRLDFLNDKKFAAWWVDQRLHFKSKSKKELVQELRIKGIAKDIIEEVLGEANVDEHQMAKNLLAKKKYMWDKYENFEARKKMSEYLLRKGYGWDVIREVIHNLDDIDQ